MLHGAEGRALESRGPGAEAACYGLGCGFGGTNSGFGRGLGFWLAGVALIRELARIDFLTIRGRWIRRATQAQVDLLRDLLVGGDRSVAPVQVQLPRGGVVLGFSDAAAGESF